MTNTELDYAIAKQLHRLKPERYGEPMIGRKLTGRNEFEYKEAIIVNGSFFSPTTDDALKWQLLVEFGESIAEYLTIRVRDEMDVIDWLGDLNPESFCNALLKTLEGMNTQAAGELK